MMKTYNPNRRGAWFEKLYKVGVGIKGIDGLAELVAGVFLLVAPQALHQFLLSLSGGMAFTHSHTLAFVAEYIARLDANLRESDLVFLIIFLLSHGVIKLVLVYCLLRKITWTYPYALTILVGFLAYQIYALVVAPSVWMTTLVVLDTIIIYLVWGEWRELRLKR